MERTRTHLLLPALAIAVLAAPAAAQHPDVTGWTDFSEILNPDGSIHKSVGERFSTFLREAFEQDEYEGERPDGIAEPHGPNCLQTWIRTHYRPSEFASHDFSTMMLLTDTMVSATVAEVHAGYARGPSLLLVLSDVQALRPGSLIPEYVIMPVSFYSYAGRLFCYTNDNHMPFVKEFVPETGEQIILLGRTVQGVVWLPTTSAESRGAIAVPDRNNETRPLIWQSGAWDGPVALPDVRDRVAEARSGGLFDLADPIQKMEEYAPERHRFSEMWGEYHQSNCRIISATRLPDALALDHQCGDAVHRHEITVPETLREHLRP